MGHGMKRLVLLLLFASSLAWSQGLEIITLRHRQAEALLPQVLPFVEPGGAVTGMNDKLFVRASARNLAEIRQLVAVLDAPQRRLMISLRQEGGDSGADRGGGVRRTRSVAFALGHDRPVDEHRGPRVHLARRRLEPQIGRASCRERV